MNRDDVVDLLAMLGSGLLDVLTSVEFWMIALLIAGVALIGYFVENEVTRTPEYMQACATAMRAQYGDGELAAQMVREQCVPQRWVEE